MAKLNLAAFFQHNGTSIKVRLQMYVFKEDGSYIVFCPALDLSAYGDTEDAAKKAFEDIMDITFKYSLTKGTFYKDLKNHGWNIKSKKQRKLKSPSFEDMLQRSEELREITTNKVYTQYSQDVTIPELA